MLSVLNTHKKVQPGSINNYRDAVTIEVNQLTVAIDAKTILDDLSFSLARGEFTALLGPNGTGKSTLLKAITDEINFQGTVKVFGQPRDAWSAEELAKHLGVLPQTSALAFNFTAKEVVELGGIGLSLANQDLQQTVELNMQLTDVTHLSKRSYPTLSGGEKQRVHLSRVLTQLKQSGENTILLLDEPTSALDLHHQHTTLALAKSLARQGATVVTVLHDLNLASQYADRMIILNQGKITIDAPPALAMRAKIIEQVYQHKVSIIPHPELRHPLVISS